MTWENYITPGAAWSAVLLSLFNTWNAFRQQRVKLKVTLKKAIFTLPDKPDHEGICLEVVNLSTFPITIGEVGFIAKGTHTRNVINPSPNDNRRVEARAKASFYCVWLPNIKKAYAKTECGKVFYGKYTGLTEIVSCTGLNLPHSSTFALQGKRIIAEAG